MLKLFQSSQLVHGNKDNLQRIGNQRAGKSHLTTHFSILSRYLIISLFALDLRNLAAYFVMFLLVSPYSLSLVVSCFPWACKVTPVLRDAGKWFWIAMDLALLGLPTSIKEHNDQYWAIPKVQAQTCVEIAHWSSLYLFCVGLHSCYCMMMFPSKSGQTTSMMLSIIELKIFPFPNEMDVLTIRAS